MSRPKKQKEKAGLELKACALGLASARVEGPMGLFSDNSKGSGAIYTKQYERGRERLRLFHLDLDHYRVNLELKRIYAPRVEDQWA
jgi:hypothetical protein